MYWLAVCLKKIKAIFVSKRADSFFKTKSVKKNEIKFREEISSANKKKRGVSHASSALRFWRPKRETRFWTAILVAKLRNLFSKFYKIPKREQFNIMVGYNQQNELQRFCIE